MQKTEFKSAEALQKVINKLERAQRKFPDDKRPAKIAKFKDQLSKLQADQPKTDAQTKIVVSSGKNHPRAGSVSGIKHFREWLGVFKSPKHALKM